MQGELQAYACKADGLQRAVQELENQVSTFPTCLNSPARLQLTGQLTSSNLHEAHRQHAYCRLSENTEITSIAAASQAHEAAQLLAWYIK